MHRRPLTGLAAASAAVAFGLVVAGASLAGRPAAAGATRPACGQPPAGASIEAAERVLTLFVRQAVQRGNVACAYDLVAPSLRKGMDRAQWARSIPVEPFVSSTPGSVYSTSSVRVVLNAEIGAWVLLEAPDLGRQVYEIALVRREGRWQVDYWGMTVDPTADFPDPQFSA